MKRTKQNNAEAQAAHNGSQQHSPLAAHILSWAAVIIATIIAAYWVVNAIGFDGPAQIIGSVLMIAVIFLMEAAALVLVANARPKGLMILPVVAAYIALELANGAAGHQGLIAIDHDGVATKRAPFEKALSAAETVGTTAQQRIDRYDAETLRLAGVRETLLKNSNGNYVTANTNAAAAGEQAAAAREEGRAVLDAQLVAARNAVNSAKLDLAKAPTPRAEWQWLLVAALFILLKAPLVWLTRSGSPVSIASGVMVRISREEADAMTEAELIALASVGKSVAQTATWALRRKTGETDLSVVA